MANDVKNISIENAKICFRNFSGKAGKYNPAGCRNFCVLIDNEFAEKLIEDGWNIKWLRPRNDGDEPQAYISVTVRFTNIPPKVFLITSKNKTPLTEDTINMLDWAEIENVDLIIRPYTWDVNGNTGIKAYLKTMYVTIVEDEFAAKYEDTPDSATDLIMQGAFEEDDEVPFR